MKRQLLAIGLAAASTLGGLAIMQPANAVVAETEQNTFRAQDITSQSTSTGNLMQGKVSKSLTTSKNDLHDQFAVTVPAGKQLRVGGVQGQHPSNVVIKLVRDDDNSMSANRFDQEFGFVTPTTDRLSLASAQNARYIIQVSLRDSRTEVQPTSYAFTWSLR